MLLLALFVIFLVPAKAGITHGNRVGGEVCDFTVKYNMLFDGVNPVNRPSFNAYLTLNATGYYETTFQYRPGDDECATPGSWEEQGVSSFSFVYEDVTFSRDNGGIMFNGPWFRHFPIGLPAANLDMNNLLNEYFEYFIFVSGVSGEDIFVPCCGDDPVCNCVCGPDETLHCIHEIVRTDCYDNTIPFSPNAVLTYKPDGTFTNSGDLSNYTVIGCGTNISTDVFSPVIIAEGSMVVYKDAQHNNVDLSTQLCPDGTPCWYFHQTPGWKGPELDLVVTMDEALGQAQRLQLQMHYQSLPNNHGPVCIYFDYTGINLDSVNDFDDTSYNKVWCGELQPYNAGLQTIFVDLPMTYGPASNDLIEGSEYGQGYDGWRPIVITGNQASSFVVYDVTLLQMGEGMQLTPCDLKRRQDGSDPDKPRIRPADYSKYIRPIPEYQRGPPPS